MNKIKVKIDENLGKTARNYLIENGFDVQSVQDENLCGTTDENLFNYSKKDQRCLITLDKDFSDIIRFNPENSYGIVVLRIQDRISVDTILKMLKNFIEYSKKESPQNNLWIVEPNRIRIHQKE